MLLKKKKALGGEENVIQARSQLKARSSLRLPFYEALFYSKLSMCLLRFVYLKCKSGSRRTSVHPKPAWVKLHSDAWGVTPGPDTHWYGPQRQTSWINLRANMQIPRPPAVGPRNLHFSNNPVDLDTCSLGTTNRKFIDTCHSKQLF